MKLCSISVLYGWNIGSVEMIDWIIDLVIFTPLESRNRMAAWLGSNEWSWRRKDTLVPPTEARRRSSTEARRIIAPADKANNKRESVKLVDWKDRTNRNRCDINRTRTVNLVDLKQTNKQTNKQLSNNEGSSTILRRVSSSLERYIQDNVPGTTVAARLMGHQNPIESHQRSITDNLRCIVGNSTQQIMQSD